MKKKNPSFYMIFLFVIGFCSLLSAQNSNNQLIEKYGKEADEFINRSLKEQKGYEWLKELCGIGPRLSGSENSLKAIHWAKNKMEELGFDSVWLQPVIVPKWVRNDVETAIVTNSKKYRGRKLNIVSLGGSIATPPGGINGEIVEVKSFDQLKLLGEKIKGKIVFFNREFDNSLVNTFEAYGKAVNQRTHGAIEAARYGAVASIVRSVTSKKDNVPHTGVMYYDSLIARIPHAAIGLIDADFLSNALIEESDLEIKIDMNCENLPDVESFNVIGEIRGKEYPEEIIVVGGHYDSWDKGCGAHDDGAPCIQTIEILDLINRLGLKPKRTIRCVLFINEENGLRGAIEYGKYADTVKVKHIAAIEADRGAFTPRGFNITSDSSIVKKLQSWLPILNKSHIDWIRPGGSGGDIAQIKNAKAWFGFVPDDQRYMDLHHSDNDTFESVHPREMQLGTAAMAILTYLLSEEGL